MIKNKKREVKNPQEYILAPGAFECYGHGWRQLWKNFLELFVILIIILFIGNLAGIFYIPMYFIVFFEKEPNFIFFIFLFTALAVLFSTIYGIFLINPVKFGLAYTYLKASRGEKFEIKEIFLPFKDYWNVVLAGFFIIIIVGFGTLFLIIPGIILACKLVFVPYIVMDKKMSATDAIKESWNMTDGHAWTVFGMALLVIPIFLAGYVCLFVGSFISIMWIYIAFASLYHAVRLEKG